MKKTKIISISIILVSLYALQSCRQEEMDQIPENDLSVEKNYTKKEYMKNENDSLKSNSVVQFDEHGNEIIDPPPKDRDQWKH